MVRIVAHPLVETWQVCHRCRAAYTNKNFTKMWREEDIVSYNGPRPFRHATVVYEVDSDGSYPTYEWLCETCMRERGYLW